MQNTQQSSWEIVKTFELQRYILQIKSNGSRYSFMTGYRKNDGVITPHISLRNQGNPDFATIFSTLFAQMNEFLSSNGEVAHADDLPVQETVSKPQRSGKKPTRSNDHQDFRSGGYKSSRKQQFNWRTLDLSD